VRLLLLAAASTLLACGRAETAAPTPAPPPPASSAAAAPPPSASASATVAPAPTPGPTASTPTSQGWDPGRGEPQNVAIRVTADGFVPKEVHLTQGRPGFLLVTREIESDCLNAVRMPWMQKAVPLPLHETVTIQIPDMSQSGEFTYACWMDMVSARVVIDPSPASDGG
jgi:hypothetical protein